MKITLFMAMSLNGMIAGTDGNEDFLSAENWKSFSELAEQHGCFIAGRKSYEIVQEWPDYNYGTIDARLKIIVSQNTDLKLERPFVRAASPKDAIEKALAENFSSAILVGGSLINSSFMAENLVDEVVLNIEPAIIGKGIPVFAEKEFERRLSLVDVTKINDGILQVRCEVRK
ncbi:dihydrofolate reductase [Candidatus Falkowbacteria bacterium]|nr:dihydrofolate reductase [Candidatus Falkowbacteria bacterium]